LAIHHTLCFPRFIQWVPFVTYCCSTLTPSSALIYLRFAGIIEYDSLQPRGNRLSFPLWRASHSRRHVFQPQSSHYASDELEASDQRTRSDPAVISKSLVKIARRLMWYPIGKLIVCQLEDESQNTDAGLSVYATVIIPVSVCRMGVAAGWNPPFWLLTCAGICFTSSGRADCHSTPSICSEASLYRSYQLYTVYLHSTRPYPACHSRAADTHHNASAHSDRCGGILWKQTRRGWTGAV
jgi:hypothetical protein